MNCQYCQTANEDDAHRCERCGRRLGAVATAPAALTGRAATALKLEVEPEIEAAARPAPAPPRPQLLPPRPRPVVEETPAPPPAAEPRPFYQASLFGPLEVASSRPAAAQERSPQRRPKRPSPEQGQLEFAPAVPETIRVDQAIEPTIYCDAPVAIATHRFMAASVDTAISMIGVGAFLVTLHVAGATIVLSARTLPYYGLAAVFVMLLYRVLFCLANADTAGLRWTGLRLLDVDGRLPTMRQRFLRLGFGVISFVAGGLGLLWALADQERLTWHDHMSNTFPTPDGNHRLTRRANF